jgi:hypothetical protein
MASGRLRLQVLDLVLDLLVFFLYLLDLQSHLPLAQDRDLGLSHALLDLSHESPVESRAQVARVN